MGFVFLAISVNSDTQRNYYIILGEDAVTYSQLLDVSVLNPSNPLLVGQVTYWDGNKWVNTNFLNQVFKDAVWDFNSSPPIASSDGNRWIVVPEYPANWYNTEWLKRQLVSVRREDVNGIDRNFPVLLYLNDQSSSISQYAEPDGSDLLVTDVGGKRKLDYELEYYNDNTADGNAYVVLWVKQKDLNWIQDTNFYVYYDNPAAALSNSTNTWDANNLYVFHFNSQTFVSPYYRTYSSKNTANFLYLRNNPVLDDNIFLGRSYLFDGLNDYAYNSVSNSDSFTYSGWFKSTTNTANRTIFGRYYTLPLSSMGQVVLLNAGKVLCRLRNSAGTNFDIESTDTYLDGNWHLATMTHDKATNSLTCYVDDKNIGAVTTSGTTVGTGGYFRLAVATVTGSSGYFKGNIDEIRIDKIARDFNWQKTRYNTEKFGNVATTWTPEGLETKATGAWEGYEQCIAQYLAPAWNFDCPNTGWAVYVENLNKAYAFNGSEWVQIVSKLNHNDLQNIQGGDDFNRYHMTSNESWNLTSATSVTSGMLAKTNANTYTGRTITGTANRIILTNGNGSSANPRVDIDLNYDQNIVSQAQSGLFGLIDGNKGLIDTNVNTWRKTDTNSIVSKLVALDSNLQVVCAGSDSNGQCGVKFIGSLGGAEIDPVYSANTHAVGMDQGVATTDTPNFVSVEAGTFSSKGGGGPLKIIDQDLGRIGYGNDSTLTYAHEFFGSVYSDTGFYGDGSNLTGITVSMDGTVWKRWFDGNFKPAFDSNFLAKDQNVYKLGIFSKDRNQLLIDLNVLGKANFKQGITLYDLTNAGSATTKYSPDLNFVVSVYDVDYEIETKRTVGLRAGAEGGTLAGTYSSLWLDIIDQNKKETEFRFDLMNKRLGVGTSTPTRTLDVKGDVNVLGTIYPTSIIASATVKAKDVNATIMDSNLYRLGNGNVNLDSTNGITWSTLSPIYYGISRSQGAWTAPNYQQLKINWGTGIILTPEHPYAAYARSYIDLNGSVFIKKDLNILGKARVNDLNVRKTLDVYGNSTIGDTTGDTLVANASIYFPNLTSVIQAYYVCWTASEGYVQYGEACLFEASPYFQVWKGSKKIEEIEFAANLDSEDKKDWQSFVLKTTNPAGYTLKIKNKKPEKDYIDSIKLIVSGTKTVGAKEGNTEFYVLDCLNPDLKNQDGRNVILDENQEIKVSFEPIPENFEVHFTTLKAFGYYLPYEKEFYLNQFNYTIDKTPFFKNNRAFFDYNYANKVNALISGTGTISLSTDFICQNLNEQDCLTALNEEKINSLSMRLKNHILDFAKTTAPKFEDTVVASSTVFTPDEPVIP